MLEPPTTLERIRSPRYDWKSRIISGSDFLMHERRNIFGRLPMARKLFFIVGVFVAIVVCVFCLGVVRSDILSGIRAYVGGEGLWSKAQKKAVFSLLRYAETRSETDYQEYLADIAVPTGDQIARLELERSKPDMAVVRRGFVQGRNSGEDVESMARLFRRFRQVSYMAQAISIWTEGDRYLDQLRQLAADLHVEVNSAHPESEKIQQIEDEIAALDGRLTPLEDEFSETLGQGARYINAVLGPATFVASALLLFLGLGLSGAVLRRIRNSDEKYRNLVNTANDAILVIDAETRVILEANGKACELLRMSDRELVGSRDDRFYPVALREVYRNYLSPISGNAAKGRELELLLADGSTVPVEVSAGTAEISGRQAVVGIFRDIRDRLEAAAVLQRREERFGHLIQNLSDLITIIAADGTMFYNSPSVERVVGYCPSELVGKSLLELIHPEDVTSVRETLERVMLNGGTLAPPEFRLLHKDGSLVWLEALGNNLLNDAAVGGIVVTSRDVTARRHLEDQIRQSQKMEAVGRLAGGLAHEFNNMLTVIRGYAEILMKRDSADRGILQSAETIIRTTENAASLTRQLLSFTRTHVFSPEIVDLNSLVDEMGNVLGGIVGEEIRLSVKLDPQLGAISVDRGQIEQLIINLVVNGRDAMPRGGRLDLETANMDVQGGTTRTDASVPLGKYVRLTVCDTGIGMDPETQSHIFEPFFTTKSIGKGTGLGLSVVYNIVRGCGGHLWVNSELARGSSFHVYFPRVESAHEWSPALPIDGSECTGTETILVAEDRPDLLWMICQYLQDLGYTVLEAKDGVAAASLAEQYKGTINVLLTDVVMPGMRGPEVVRRLASTRPDMKVIYMSGYTEGSFGSDSEEELVKSAPLLQKPFKLNDLALKIREVLIEASHP
jgi:two-component system, cell cycle sensor histidine kinase and response regulator CckA